MQVVVETQLTDTAAVEPNLNIVVSAPIAKPEPVTVTVSPPVREPVLGLKLVTVGDSNLK